MGETSGILAAILSSALGGTAVGATRYLVSASDPLTLGALRFGMGFALLLPVALLQGGTWPPRRDWPGVTSLGVLFFGLFPILFNASLLFTTAARGALALSTAPLLTMVVGAVLRVEPLTVRKTIGVLVAMLGVTLALLAGLASAPQAAWRGDLLMVGAALCMALYSVWSKSFLRRASPIPFTTIGTGIGALCLVIIAWASGGFASMSRFGTSQWIAVAYLGTFASAPMFLLWVFALSRTTPTRVAISISVNPIAASLVGALLLSEPIHWNLVAGLAAVFLGIWIASSVTDLKFSPRWQQAAKRTP